MPKSPSPRLRRQFQPPNLSRRNALAERKKAQMQALKNLERLSRKDAQKYGRAQRKHLSRSKLGKYKTGERQFDPLQIIQESSRNRIARLIPVKYQLMAASMFAFYRGTVEIMAA